jgi:hypothetical protein
MHHHVGAESTEARVHAEFFSEVAVQRHAGKLKQTAQLHLPPAAADLRRFERVDQPRGLVLQGHLSAGKAFELFIDRAQLANVRSL